jgi:hypothetical protein
VLRTPWGCARRGAEESAEMDGGAAARAEGDGGDPAHGVVPTVTEGVGWMPRPFVPKKDVA